MKKNRESDLLIRDAATPYVNMSWRLEHPNSSPGMFSLPCVTQHRQLSTILDICGTPYQYKWLYNGIDDYIDQERIAGASQLVWCLKLGEQKSEKYVAAVSRV